MGKSTINRHSYVSLPEGNLVSELSERSSFPRGILVESLAEDATLAGCSWMPVAL